MSRMCPFPFLRLPFELRLQVYGYIAEAVPRTTPMAMYSGFYLSCRQIKQEFEDEYMKAYTPYITHVANKLPPHEARLLSIPSTFATAQHITIRFQKSGYTPFLYYIPDQIPYDNFLKKAVRRLMKGYFGSLEIRFEHLPLTQLSIPIWIEWIKPVLFVRMKKKGKVNAGRLVFVFDFPEGGSSDVVQFLRPELAPGDGWTLDGIVRDGEKVICRLVRE